MGRRLRYALHAAQAVGLYPLVCALALIPTNILACSTALGAAGLVTHVWVTERGVQRVVPYNEALGMTIMAMGNEKHTVQNIVDRLVRKKPPGWSDVVLPKSHPDVI